MAKLSVWFPMILHVPICNLFLHNRSLCNDQYLLTTYLFGSVRTTLKSCRPLPKWINLKLFRWAQLFTHCFVFHFHEIIWPKHSYARTHTKSLMLFHTHAHIRTPTRSHMHAKVYKFWQVWLKKCCPLKNINIFIGLIKCNLFDKFCSAFPSSSMHNIKSI